MGSAHGINTWPRNLLKTDFPLKLTIIRCLCKPQSNIWKYDMMQYIFVRSSTGVKDCAYYDTVQCSIRQENIENILMWVDFSQSQDWLLYLLKWFKSISRWICSAEFAQAQFCGLFTFFSISLISSFQRRIISPFLGNYVTFPIFNYVCIKENSKWLSHHQKFQTFSREKKSVRS